ncbi:MAG TPA: ABC transporter permease [Gemmatimonadales bacterium]|nr:ABC transporter permease [Gemmatimonadales bacterium]
MSRAYRALLRLYPASFRAEYGEEMAYVFQERWRATRGAGRLALAAEIVGDTVRNAAGAHLEILRQDLRYTARSLRRTPAFAVTAVLVVALGVGANTAVFSLADHVLIRPLPFPDAARLVKLWQQMPGYQRVELSPATYRDWTTGSMSLGSAAAFHTMSANLVGQGAPERLDGVAATAGFFPTLGVAPAIGRPFTSDDDRPGAPGTVILSHGLWQRRFAGDPAVVGRRVRLDGESFEVIGVMPPGFNFPRRDVAFWTTERFEDQDYEDRTNSYLQAVARLAPGVSLERARSEIATVAARLERTFPDVYENQGSLVIALRDEIAPQTRLLLLALCGAALCALLVACANLAGLLLARAAARRKELALRTALGAGRERLTRQLVTESLALAALGGTAGVLVALGTLPLIARLVPETLPGAAAPALDLRALGLGAVLTALTGLAFGVVPALGAGRAGGLGELRGGPARRQRLRAALVIVEVAASVVLLASAGLLLRALWRVQAVDPGFTTEGVLTLRTALPTPRYDTTARRIAFYDRVLGETRALPGVTAAAYASFLPMAMTGGIWPVTFGGADERRGRAELASLRFVTPEYFRAMDVPVRLGRDVSPRDVEASPRVAVVSESFARRHWPGEDPLGRRFTIATEERSVVGVVGDVRVRGLERTSEPQVYLPAAQVADGNFAFYAPKDLVVRSSGDPRSLVPAITDIVRRADPEQPVSNVRLMEEIVTDQTASRAVQARVLGLLALVAMLLAGVGIHGLLSYAVATRTREIGVRLALGARPSGIVRLVLGQAVLLAVAGVLPGVLLAYLAGRTMAALLASVQPGDAATFAAVVLVCLVTAAAGAAAPALRALKVDPMLALRAE